MSNKTIRDVLDEFGSKYLLTLRPKMGKVDFGGARRDKEQALASIAQILEEAKPQKKHHTESDRNIAYREGFNDATEQFSQALAERLGK